METEYDDNDLDVWKIQNGIYIVKMKKDDELDGDDDTKNDNFLISELLY